MKDDLHHIEGWSKQNFVTGVQSLDRLFTSLDDRAIRACTSRTRIGSDGKKSDVYIHDDNIYVIQPIIPSKSDLKEEELKSISDGLIL